MSEITELNSHWAWVPGWRDAPEQGEAGKVVTFRRTFHLDSVPSEAVIRCTADTRYKLIINEARTAVGPTRGSPETWYYDTLDIAPWLKKGENEVIFKVIRFYPTNGVAVPFARTKTPGITVIGEAGGVDLSMSGDWDAKVEEGIHFPVGSPHDAFLHVYEDVKPIKAGSWIKPIFYVGTGTAGFGNRNGEQFPWRLEPRIIPMPEESALDVKTIRKIDSTESQSAWEQVLTGKGSIKLPPFSSHRLELQAECHSTAFLDSSFDRPKTAGSTMRLTYSEGYEGLPVEKPNAKPYPWARNKGDRLDSEKGSLFGPSDSIDISSLPGDKVLVYEPFWWRTFRHIVLEVQAGPAGLTMNSFKAQQTNYPLEPKGSWKANEESEAIWDMSLRTLRNCMFDGYSDCPFFEQLQYAQDARSSGMFHYLYSGDDRLMRQTILAFLASMTPEGVVQSRYPSHHAQIIVGFALFWVMQVHDHLTFFNDVAFAKSLLPAIDRVLGYFEAHIDDRGLVSGFKEGLWQYVDWTVEWEATADHRDSGVPLSGRKSNTHTYFSMVYAYTLTRASELSHACGRPGLAEEYATRRSRTVEAVQKNCYDGSFYTDSTTDVNVTPRVSQHCQVWAVLADIAPKSEHTRLIRTAFAPDHKFIKASFKEMHYAFRAFSKAGIYEEMWERAWEPWRDMLRNNMSTCLEDDVRYRSDCHAWGSVALYEYPVEVAGVKPAGNGWSAVRWEPRVGLFGNVESKLALGGDNTAKVTWKGGKVKLELEKAVKVVSQLNGKEVDHDSTKSVELDY